MSLTPEGTFTNPQIVVESPPPFENVFPPQEYAKYFFYATLTSQGIDSDNLTDIVNLAQKPQSFQKLLIRRLSTESDTYIQDPAADLLNVYNNPMLVGDTTTVQDPPLGFPSTDEIDAYDGYIGGLSLTSTNSTINTPLYSLCDFGYLNAFNKKLAPSTVYTWRASGFNPPVAIVSLGIDKKVQVIPNPLNKNAAYGVYINVVGDESDGLPQEAISQEVNSFTLFLTVQPGGPAKLKLIADNPGDPAQNAQPSWSVVIQFGDVTATVEEGSGSLKVTIDGSDTTKNALIPIDISKVTDPKYNSGNKNPYGITFIPVWNGLLVTDYIDDSEDSLGITDASASDFVFLPKQSTRSIASEVLNIVDGLTSDDLPRFGQNAENLSAVQYFMLSDDNDVRVDTGTTVNVTFNRCGGKMRFSPLYFSPEITLHTLIRGERNEGSLDGDSEVDEDSGVIDQPPVTNFQLIPIIHVDAGENFESNSGIFNLTSGVNPIWDGIVDLTTSRWSRRPMEVWGFYLYGVHPPLSADATYKNQDGELTNLDVPSERIQKVSIKRDLQGSGGVIEWDLYDPVTGLTDRPPQDVGGIRISVIGGVDTENPEENQDAFATDQNVDTSTLQSYEEDISGGEDDDEDTGEGEGFGVIFTGIAVGNEESDTADSNVISLPLHDRAIKGMEDWNGIRLLNGPFFDGYDHRDVLQYLCDMLGVPFQSFSDAYNLPTGTIMAPNYNFRSNTAIWNAIKKVAEDAMTVVFFDRFGVLTQYNMGQTSGNDWSYTAANVISYSDKPDLSSMATFFAVCGLVTYGPLDLKFILENGLPRDGSIGFKMVTNRVDTYPSFGWDKMFFYAINGTLPEGEFNLAAQRIAYGFSRARAAGNVSIAGNSEIELLDTFNGIWVITSISHDIIVGKEKRWDTHLGLELLVGDVNQQNAINPQNQGSPPLSIKNNFALTPKGSGKLPTQGTNPFGSQGINTTVTPGPGFTPDWNG